MRSAKKWLVRLALGGSVVIVLVLSGARAIMGRVCTHAKPLASQKSEVPFFEGLPRVLNIAHRGASKSAPEHSTRAFELALRQGAHVLELDLRATRDQVLVVAHDKDLERTLGLEASLAELSWAELEALAGERAPLRLDEVFARFPLARFNLELKDESLEPARVLARLIVDRGVAERVLVASARHAVLSEFRNASENRVATSASTREVLAFHFCYLLGQSCQAPFVALQLPPLGWLGLTRAEFIRHAHAQGVLVHFWTIDDEPKMRALLEAGADGLMTNRPELLDRVLAEGAG